MGTIDKSPLECGAYDPNHALSFGMTVLSCAKMMRTRLSRFAKLVA